MPSTQSPCPKQREGHSCEQSGPLKPSLQTQVKSAAQRPCGVSVPSRFVFIVQLCGQNCLHSGPA